MRKINSLLTANSQLEALAKNVQAHQHLQQFWQSAAPPLLAESSFASSFINGQLTVYADSAIVANKIKLTHASLLTQLQNLQKNNQQLWQYKITAIIVKVQVKSRPKTVTKSPRLLSNNAAVSLKNLANILLQQNKGESALASMLAKLANKAK